MARIHSEKCFGFRKSKFQTNFSKGKAEFQCNFKPWQCGTDHKVSKIIFLTPCIALSMLLLTDEICEYIAAGVHFYFIEPLRKTVECGLTADVINKNQSISWTVITLRDRTKSFLSSCVPNLQLKTWWKVWYVKREKYRKIPLLNY